MGDKSKSKQVTRNNEDELMNEKEDSEQGSQLQSAQLEESMGNEKRNN